MYFSHDLEPDYSRNAIMVVSRVGKHFKIEAATEGENREFFTKIKIKGTTEIYIFVKIQNFNFF